MACSTTGSMSGSMASSRVRCVICGLVPTRTLPIRRHVGRIVARRTVAVRKPLCEEHGAQVTKAFLHSTLVHGWWGPVSVIVNLGVIVSDLAVLAMFRLLPTPSVAADPSPVSTALMALAGVRPDASPGEWRADLYMRHQYRWFSGTAWTEHVSDDGLLSTDPPGWKQKVFA